MDSFQRNPIKKILGVIVVLLVLGIIGYMILQYQGGMKGGKNNTLSELQNSTLPKLSPEEKRHILERLQKSATVGAGANASDAEIKSTLRFLQQ